jgi:hypothetical protein
VERDVSHHDRLVFHDPRGELVPGFEELSNVVRQHDRVAILLMDDASESHARGEIVIDPVANRGVLDPVVNTHLPIIAMRPAASTPISPPATVMHILDDGLVVASDQNIR